MKSLVFVTIAALSATTFAEAAQTTAKTTDEPAKPKMSLREKIAERQAKAGGLIEAPVTGQVVRVSNMQTRVKAEDVRAIIEKIQDKARIPLVYTDKACELTGSLDSIKGGVLLLTDKADYPSVLVAPENAWAAVNVAKLAADEPGARRLKERLEKEMWRALCMSLGASNAIFQPCLLRTMRTLKDLDYCSNEIPSPEPMGKLEDAAKEFGILRMRKVTYKAACFEGWAPAPTNEIQKTIYEGVKDGSIKPYVPPKK